MCLCCRCLQRVWKWAVVPLLGALLLFQYSVLLGLPPSLRQWLLNLLAHDYKGGALDLPEEVEVSRACCCSYACSPALGTDCCLLREGLLRPASLSVCLPACLPPACVYACLPRRSGWA